MQAYGLRTHSWNTGLRSILLLAGFPMLLALTMLGLGLMFGSEQHDLGRAFRNALRNLPLLYLAGCGVAAVWFAIAYMAHNRILDWATGAHPVTRAEEPRLWNLTENLCISRGMRMPRLAIIETPALNAYAAGLTPDKGAVTVTRGLMEALDDRELQAVVAHELAHIRNGDARLGLIAVVFVGIISLGFDMMTRTRRVARASGWRYRGSGSGSGNRNAGAAALIGLAIIALAWGLAVVLRMMLSRNREFLADAGAVELTSDADAMISALRKVEGNAAMPEVSPQVRALFLEDAGDNALSSLMATHPPIPKRVEALVTYAGGRDPGPMPPRGAWDAPDPADPAADNDATIRVAPAPAPWWQGPAQGATGAAPSPWGPRR
ncbi:M48 family metallopeptidase [Roseomonas sp. HF4]|uniref:M48 family metallopeptidase n=1 Tax=Roseomonas sp. HF4 TaxID=2562313 RepID=UPI0010C145B7|nr:M48 family metallopeptidase [Roseomonas sp. HF4]